LLNYKKRVKLLRLSRKLPGILVVMIMFLIFVSTIYVSNSIYNNVFIDNNTKKVDSVTVGTYNTPITTILPRNTTLTSRGDINRNVVEKSIVESVVVNDKIDTKVTEKKIEKKTEVDFEYVDSRIFNITMYTLAYNECGKSPSHPEYGIGASGSRVKENSSIAMGKSIPFGTKVRIEGFDATFTNVDTGTKIYNDCIDVFTNNLTQARKWGRQKKKVWIISWGNGKVK